VKKLFLRLPCSPKGSPGRDKVEKRKRKLRQGTSQQRNDARGFLWDGAQKKKAYQVWVFHKEKRGRKPSQEEGWRKKVYAAGVDFDRAQGGKSH